MHSSSAGNNRALFRAFLWSGSYTALCLTRLLPFLYTVITVFCFTLLLPFFVLHGYYRSYDVAWYFYIIISSLLCPSTISLQYPFAKWQVFFSALDFSHQRHFQDGFFSHPCQCQYRFLLDSCPHSSWQWCRDGSSNPYIYIKTEIITYKYTRSWPYISGSNPPSTTVFWRKIPGLSLFLFLSGKIKPSFLWK